MRDQSICEIYERHKGPYSILLVVENKKGQHQSARVEGMFPDGRTAHEAGRVQAQTEGVVEAFVYSEHEKQFIGMFYTSGTTYRSWEDERGRMELPTQRPAPALVQGRPEPVQPMDDSGDDQLPPRSLPVDRPVRDVPTQERPAVRTQRAPRKIGAALIVGNTEGWPTGAAQEVRTYVQSHQPVTCKEIVAALGPRLNEMGVQFPAALVSRLKQAGYVKEATA